jgi:hypothetical protein
MKSIFEKWNIIVFLLAFSTYFVYIAHLRYDLSECQNISCSMQEAVKFIFFPSATLLNNREIDESPPAYTEGSLAYLSSVYILIVGANMCMRQLAKKLPTI